MCGVQQQTDTGISLTALYFVPSENLEVYIDQTAETTGSMPRLYPVKIPLYSSRVIIQHKITHVFCKVLNV